MNYTLGFDTSCYTTSVAILDEAGSLIADVRRILKVKPGNRGLAQSEMVFQHTRNLPELFNEAVTGLPKPLQINAIGVSAYPRPLPDSYMPAFLVGTGYGSTLAAAYDCNLHKISHQEGHVFAGLWSAKGPTASDFLAVHVSGGTTEIVQVKKHDFGIDIKLLGESQDLHAGQFIDRIGVALGLPFPAGRHLEKMAKLGRDTAIEIPSVVKKMNVSFSGPESHTNRLLQQEQRPESVAAGVELCVAKTLSKMIKHAKSATGLSDVLVVGGVSSNQFIRQYLYEKLTRDNITLYFPQHEYSPDNAVGVAYSALTYAP